VRDVGRTRLGVIAVAFIMRPNGGYDVRNTRPLNSNSANGPTELWQSKASATAQYP